MGYGIMFAGLYESARNRIDFISIFEKENKIVISHITDGGIDNIPKNALFVWV